MKKSKLSESKIVTMLKEYENGESIDNLCRTYDISSSTFYTLKAQYSGMEISHMKKLKELERENIQLKKMFADCSLENDALKDVIAKKLGG